MNARDLAEQLGPERARLSGVEAELPMAAPESLDALIELVHRAREGHLHV